VNQWFAIPSNSYYVLVYYGNDIYGPENSKYIFGVAEFPIVIFPGIRIS
jgi:hypothetical protein